MVSSLIAVFNPLFTGIALLALLLSFWVVICFKSQLSLLMRIGVILSCIFVLYASFCPLLTRVLVISFIPTQAYHFINPLTLAPLLLPFIAFAGIWALLTLAHALYGLIDSTSQPKALLETLLAVMVITFMMFEVRYGLLDYRIIFNSEAILKYASVGRDPSHLRQLYFEVAAGRDEKIFAEALSQFALNNNVPADILQLIYSQSLRHSIDPVKRDYILLNLSRNEHTSPELLKIIMIAPQNANSSSVKDGALTNAPHNPNFSEKTLLQLANYPNCEIRRAIISYPQISEDILNHIIKNDPDVGVRHDAKTRLDFLHGISHLEKNKKSTSSEEKPNQLPEQALNAASAIDLQRIFILASMTENAALILENLASNCFINENLARDIFTATTNLKGYRRTAILIALSINPKTPLDVLNAIAHEGDLIILRALASNPNLPATLISQLSHYSDCKIKKQLICIPTVNNLVLRHLMRDGDESVALEASQRLRQDDVYLDGCKETKKLNPSCQKFYAPDVPDVRKFPSTSMLNNHQVNS